MLIPPDIDKCQAEKPNGQSFMTLGGGHKMIRCTTIPTYIATEKVAGSDGQRGSMSLCDACREVLINQAGEGFAVFSKIERSPK